MPLTACANGSIKIAVRSHGFPTRAENALLKATGCMSAVVGPWIARQVGAYDQQEPVRR